MREFDIDFRNLIPPLSKEEHKLLTGNIRKDGCRDPIVVWTETLSSGEPGRTMILDGHNRYDICRKYKIDFSTTKLKLKDRGEAKIWVIRNQLGRRNLTSYQRGKLTLELKSIIQMIQKKAKEKQSEGGKRKVRQNSAQPPIKVRDELAKLAGVSHDTIHKVEIIEKEAPPEIKEAIEKGKISINKAYKQTLIKNQGKPAVRKLGPPSNGMQFARMAIMDLEKITDDDLERDEAFASVKGWFDNPEMPPSYYQPLERFSIYINSISDLDQLEPDVYNGLMKSLTDLGKRIGEITLPFRVEQMAREAEEAKKKDEEIDPLLMKDEKDLTEEEKAKVDACYEAVSPYYLHKEKFEKCVEAWRCLSKSQKKEFIKRYCAKEVTP